MTNRLPDQPIERTLRVIGGRWKMAILYHLMGGDAPGPKRQSELMRLIPSVSQKVLIQQLREMEGHGLVTRTVHPVVPPHVDYAATPLAEDLSPIAEAMCAWGRRHADALERVD
ncbi:MAG: helix-turn-helix domain-containing protein [Pseudomonadota bacterium]